MNRSANEPLTEDVAREVCRHTGSKAMVTGFIDRLQKDYILGLKAVDCNSGDVLAEAQERAPDKDTVLQALDEAAMMVRKQLGEPLRSVEKYATPVAGATTPSLEAWRSYSMATKAESEQGSTAAVPFYKRAVEIDPNFALAYIGLSFVYGNLYEQLQLSEEYGRKAFELRDKVSGRERFSIEANYYMRVTGELDKAARIYEQWQQSYPRDVTPPSNLRVIYGALGHLEKALEASRETLRLAPNSGLAYGDLSECYVNLNRLDEAAVVFQRAEEHKVLSDDLLPPQYSLAFLRGDAAQMSQLAAAAQGKPGTEAQLLAAEANTARWFGRFKAGHKLTRQAMDSAQRDDAKEAAAVYLAGAAMFEVAVGHQQEGRAAAATALKMSPRRRVEAVAALALAQAGDIAAGEKLAAELSTARPFSTHIQRYWLPTFRATVALQRKDATRALNSLADTRALELTDGMLDLPLVPAYLRGQAYLMLGDGKAAAGEFRKFVDHYGLVRNSPWGALARLGLARAYALQSETDPATRDRTRIAYENFLTLWKDADPDLPIYKQAKAEYAKLR
jgi:tetratricopeptide (TPR) repeat protein